MKLRYKVLFVVLSTLLIPYLFTLIVNGKIKIERYKSVESGKYILIHNDNKVNKFDVEKFIPCILMSQMDLDYEEETLKAQAVIIRTYIYKLMEDRSTINYENLMLEYVSYESMQSLWKEEFTNNYNYLMKIMQETALQIIKYENNIIYPYYHKVSAKKTRNGKEIFENDSYSYLKQIECPYDIDSKDYLSITMYTRDDFLTRMKGTFNDLTCTTENIFENIVIDKRCSAEYVVSMHVGDKVISGEEFMEIMNIKSSNFYIDKVDEKIRITCYGSGHGLGFNLYYANVLAKEGFKYIDLLLQFYQNIEVTNE